MRILKGETAGPMGTHILPAGVEWDAVRVPRYLGLAALDQFPSSPGPVIVDPQSRTLYFFVPKGSTDSWSLPQITPLRESQFLVVPPETRISPPGPYWLVEPGPGDHRMPMANPDELYSVLARAVEETPSPPEPGA